MISCIARLGVRSPSRFLLFTVFLPRWIFSSDCANAFGIKLKVSLRCDVNGNKGSGEVGARIYKQTVAYLITSQYLRSRIALSSVASILFILMRILPPYRTVPWCTCEHKQPLIGHLEHWTSVSN